MGRGRRIVARNAAVSASRLSTVRVLPLGDANFALHLAALGPADVRQGISQDALRPRIDGDFHLAAMETGGSAGRFLRKEPNIYPLRRCLVDLARVAERLLQSAHRF